MSRWPRTDNPHRSAEPRPTLFLDRDGVLVVEKDYLSDPGQVELVPGVAEALLRARIAGWQLVGVSNQSGLGRGRFTLADFEAVMNRLDEILTAAGCPLDAFFYCPHAPSEGCRCRKPGPGLLDEAAAELAWDQGRSWVIGDKVSDVDLALNHGLKGVLVRTGHGAEQEPSLGPREGVVVCDDLPAAIDRNLEAGP